MPTTDLILDIVSFVLGLLFVLLAVLAGGRMPTGKFKYTGEKRSFEIDPVPLLLLMGLAMAGTSAYFRYKVNDAQTKQLADEQSRNDKLSAGLDKLSAELDQFKNERLLATLTLSDFDDPSLLKSVYATGTSSKGERTSKVQFTHKSGNEFWAPVDGLELGSTVSFQAEDTNGKMWTGSLTGQLAQAAVDMQPKKKGKK